MELESSHTAERWNRIKSLFVRAIELDPDQRSQFLSEQSDDLDLVTEVLALLRSHTEADGSDYLSDSPVDRSGLSAAARPGKGVRFGPWVLDSLIGEGGMGQVYSAHRADGAFERTVAIKLLRRDKSTQGTRFTTEAKILARLEHPNIARLYDAGIDNGVPYLAMALLEGKPITEFTEEKQLTVRERVSMFLQVTDAVTYAHGNLVVHRDIKPSNILVDDSGVATLLDFGIARMVDEQGIETAQTIHEGHALTLAYAAPEQVRMQPITTATDVYSLGLVLYELLAKRSAYRIRGKSLTEIERIICELDPSLPSSVANDSSTLRGDLDAIVLKAIEKSPERRYASVHAFASDLRRYLVGMPIEVRPPSSSYRFRKFVSRHRGTVAAAASICVALIIGLSAAVWQAHVAAQERDLAEKRFETAREMAGQALFDIHDAIADVPGSTAVRELIVSRSLSYLAQLAADAGNDLGLRLDLASAYLRIGNVQGNPNNANLGRLDEALQSYDRGLKILPGTTNEDSSAARVQRLRAVINEKRADVFAALGRTDSVDAVMSRARGYLTNLVDRNPQNPDLLKDLAINLIKTGDLAGNPNFPNAGRLEDSITDYVKALATLDRVTHVAEVPEGFLRIRGVVHERLGAVYLASGRADDAIANYKQSFSIREQLFHQNPNHLDIFRDLGVAHEKLALVLQSQGKLSESQAEFEQALAVFQDLADADDANVQAQRSLAIEYLHLAELMYSNNGSPSFRDLTASRSFAAKARALLLKDGQGDPADTRLTSLIEWADQLTRRHRQD